MKKRFFAALAAAALMGALALTADASEQYKIGMSMISTSDAVVAQALAKAKEAAEARGMDVLISDSNNDAAAQMDAVENFIETGCDCIVIQAIDATSMSAKAQEAMDKGIKVIAYGIGLDAYDCWYKNDNTLTGHTIGTMAGEWINENLGGEAKVAIIDYSLIEVLIERADAIEESLKELCPNAEVVARFDAIDAATGMSSMESALAAHPDINVVCSISDGSAVGAYEAMKSAGKDTDEYGIFGSDLSTVALNYIKAGTCYRGTTDADNTVCGERMIDIAEKLLKGEETDDIVVMDVVPVTAENIDEYEAYMK